MKITTAGIDVAKTLLQVHGVDERGRAVIRKRLKRGQVLAYFANVTPCLIGMEACGSAHYWARRLAALGHTVKLMAPQFVKPYVKTNKNDAADAEAICEAVARSNMRFVPVKSAEQQGGAGAAPSAARVCQSAHGASQPDPWVAGRVRGCHPAGYRPHRQVPAGDFGRW